MVHCVKVGREERLERVLATMLLFVSWLMCVYNVYVEDDVDEDEGRHFDTADVNSDSAASGDLVLLLTAEHNLTFSSCHRNLEPCHHVSKFNGLAVTISQDKRLYESWCRVADRPSTSLGAPCFRAQATRPRLVAVC
jgi:hypothetical protein